jgi:hypothetical protein
MEGDPMYILGKELQLPIVSTGVGWWGQRLMPLMNPFASKTSSKAVHMAHMLSGLSAALETTKNERVK